MTNEEFLAEVQRRTGSATSTMKDDIKQGLEKTDLYALRNCAAWLLEILTKGLPQA